jgi:hypothetical protein
VAKSALKSGSKQLPVLLWYGDSIRVVHQNHDEEKIYEVNLRLSGIYQHLEEEDDFLLVFAQRFSVIMLLPVTSPVTLVGAFGLPFSMIIPTGDPGT